MLVHIRVGGKITVTQATNLVRALNAVLEGEPVDVISPAGTTLPLTVDRLQSIDKFLEIHTESGYADSIHDDLRAAGVDFEIEQYEGSTDQRYYHRQNWGEAKPNLPDTNMSVFDLNDTGEITVSCEDLRGIMHSLSRLQATSAYDRLAALTGQDIPPLQPLQLVPDPTSDAPAEREIEIKFEEKIRYTVKIKSSLTDQELGLDDEDCEFDEAWFELLNEQDPNWSDNAEILDRDVLDYTDLSENSTSQT